MENLVVRIIGTKTFVKPENYNQILTTRIEDLATFTMTSSIKMGSKQVLLKQGELSTTDFPLNPFPTTKIFLTFSDWRPLEITPLATPKTLLYLSIQLSEEKQFYTRSVYSLLSLIEGLGGFIACLQYLLVPFTWYAHRKMINFLLNENFSYEFKMDLPPRLPSEEN